MKYTSQNLSNVFNTGVDNTLMLPSADPLMKQSSVGSTARALTGESWARKLWRWRRGASSRTLIQPFLPPVMSSCCLEAIRSTVAPDSWQQNAEEKDGIFLLEDNIWNKGWKLCLFSLPIILQNKKKKCLSRCLEFVCFVPPTVPNQLLLQYISNFFI